MRLSCALNHLLTYLLTYMRIDSNWTMALYKSFIYLLNFIYFLTYLNVKEKQLLLGRSST